MKNRIKTILAIFMIGFIISACVPKQADVAGKNESKPKNVIMLIGDGMGPEQIGLLLTYARQAPNSVIIDRKTSFDRIMEQGGIMGMSMTHADNVLVVDSAASGSQLASGQFAGSEMIGLDKDGNSVETIVEKAIKAGKATGLVSDTRVTHATPAAFAAHQPHRDLENEIAVDMINAGPDVMFGGGLRYFVPQEANDKNAPILKELEKMTQGAVKIKSKRKDSRNLLIEAQQKGYALAFDKSQMESSKGKVLGLFTTSAMPDGIEVNRTKDDPKRTIPTLKEMSSKAIDILSKNEKGFFLMIEAGLIDWAAHYNDTGLMLHEMLVMNDTLEYILNWAKDRDDTLIVVTADHTTGGFGFSYQGKGIPEAKSLSGKSFQNRKFAPEYNFGNPAVLDKIYNQDLSYSSIFLNKFDVLPKQEQTPATLAKLVNQHTRFPITEEQAARVLEQEDNPMFVEGHGYMGTKTVPKLLVKDEFFVYQTDDNRQNLLALEVASAQSVVWNTGTHTSTPVIVFAKGSPKAMSPFGSILHHTQVGRNLIDAVLNK